MKKYCCDVCCKSILRVDMYTIEFFKTKYEICEEHYQEMNKYYHESITKAEEQFITRFSKVID